ncbi:MAG: hypothetical protein AAFZ65_01615 [Planctomycetota bacterium]
MKLTRLALAAPLVLLACATPGSDAPDAKAHLGAAVKAAHGADLYSAGVVRTDFSLVAGGTPAMAGSLAYEAATGRSRIDLDGGVTIVFDGQSAWVSPAEAQMQGARFHVLTWPYFMAAPWKLADPGTRITEAGLAPLGGTQYLNAKLEFESGVGDSPDDWYEIYADPTSNRLEALAYIVTYGPTSVDEAEAEPHVALYSNYIDVEGMQLATRMVIKDWAPTGELGADDLYLVTFGNYSTGPAREGEFDQPADAREDALPR